jgi:hypothetical protein
MPITQPALSGSRSSLQQSARMPFRFSLRSLMRHLRLVTMANLNNLPDHLFPHVVKKPQRLATHPALAILEVRTFYSNRPRTSSNYYRLTLENFLRALYSTLKGSHVIARGPSPGLPEAEPHVPGTFCL